MELITILDAMKKMKKLEEKVEKAREDFYSRYRAFVNRYNKAFDTELSHGLYGIKPLVLKERVKIVSFLLDEGIESPEKSMEGLDILKRIKIPLNRSRLFYDRTALSPLGVGIIDFENIGGRSVGYYIANREKAELWLKFMKELTKV